MAKKISGTLAFFAIVSIVGCKGAPVNETVEVKTAPLGQNPPGMTSERFAPGLVSTDNWEFAGSFTPDMQEYYFINEDVEASEMKFVVVKYENGQWERSIISPRIGQPFISPDGNTMHLGKRYKERQQSGWSERKDLGGEFEHFRIMRLTASSRGTYYFDEVGNEGDGKIRYSKLVDGVRQSPKLASDVINSGTWLAHPFIAPDESYLLWDGKRDEGFGDSDIYISFRQEDGKWGSAINLGDQVNTEAWEAGASVTPDGKFLIFNRNVGSSDFENVDVFWINAQIIEDLRRSSS